MLFGSELINRTAIIVPPQHYYAKGIAFNLWEKIIKTINTLNKFEYIKKCRNQQPYNKYYSHIFMIQFVADSMKENRIKEKAVLFIHFHISWRKWIIIIPLQSWISYEGTSARCLQSWYCDHFHNFLPCFEAAPASFLSAVEMEERKRGRKTSFKSIPWAQYRLVVWIMEFGPDLIPILLCHCHLLSACAFGIPVPLRHLLIVGMDLLFRLSPWPEWPQRSGVKHFVSRI